MGLDYTRDVKLHARDGLDYAKLLPELTEAERDELLALAVELEHPLLLGEVSLEVVSLEDTTIKPQVYTQPMRTWNRNYFNILAMHVCSLDYTDDTDFASGHLNYKDYLGTLYDDQTSYCAGATDFRGSQAEVIQGIIVGTGGGAEDFEGYNLTTPVAHGSGAGELFYYAQVNPVWIWNVGPRTWTIILPRYYNNYSGGDIVIDELGIFSLQYATTTSNKYVMVARDLLSSPVTVSHLEQLRAAYTLTTTAMPS